MDFDKLRWKMADELTTDEAQIIVDNQDKLNDEEKAAFSDLLLQSQPLPDNPLDDQLTKAGDETTPPPAPVEPKTPETPTPPALPENVVTQDKLDDYLEGKRKEWEAEGKTKIEQDKEEKKIQQYFEDGYTPKDWNEYTNAMVDKIAPVIEQRILNTLDQQNKKFTEEQDKLKKTQQEVFDRFESEFATLAKSKLIPDPAQNPDEYKKVHAAIIKIGDENGKTNVTDAYKLWSIIPEEHGGGLKTQGNNNEQAKIERQKEAAGKIGSGRGAPASSKPGGPPSWAQVHNNNLDTLIENRLKQA